MAFNRYHKWLGISPKIKRPTYYQLLGVDFDEKDIEVIQSAAEKQRSHVQQFEQGSHHEEAAQLISELDDAELTLASPNLRKNYNRRFNLNQNNTRHSGIRPSGGRTVGESSGLFREYLGIMSVILGGFIIMAAASFLLPWQKLMGDNQEKPAKPATAPNQITSMESSNSSDKSEKKEEIIYSVEISPQDAQLKSDSEGVVISGEGKQRKVVVSNSNKIEDFVLTSTCSGFQDYEQRIQIDSKDRNVVIRLEPLPTEKPTTPQKLSEDRLAAAWVIQAGGKLDIVYLDGQTSEIKFNLPEVPFHISKINLQSLDRITNNDLRRFSKLQHLTSLNLMKTPITDDGLEHVGKIQSLEELRLSGNGFRMKISDNGLRYLYGLKSLEKLDVQNTQVTKQGVAAFERSVRGCTVSGP